MAISITEDIRDLLYENQLVIIQGLGMITASYNSAKIKEADEIIAPPSLHYSFDNRIKESDGILEKFIEKKYNLSEEQSRQVVKRFKEQVLNLLEKHKKIVIQGVGKLQREGDSIVLRHYEGTEDPISYGLPELSLKISAAESSISAVQQTSLHDSHQKKTATSSSTIADGQRGTVKDQGDKKASASQEKGQEEESSSEERTKENAGGRKKSVFPWILVLLLVLSFLVVLFSGLYLLNDNVSGFVHKLLNQEKKENIMDKEAERASDSSVKSMDDESKANEPVTSDEKLVPAGDNADCVIVVGLFGDEENVRRITNLI
ncbi:MAG TPA: hypothetical protein VJ917_00445, partial [Saprospiraceae bacterium]|nr:hypothetical protein [Saprospiraceae bacterium]